MTNVLDKITDIQKDLRDLKQLLINPEKLLPCPLCNREVKIYDSYEWSDRASAKGNFTIGCDYNTGGCGCSVASPYKDKVISKWNRRVSL